MLERLRIKFWKKKFVGHRPSLRSQLLGAIGRNGVKWPIKVRICFYLAKHLKTVLGTRKNHRNLKRTFGEGVDNYGIVHSNCTSTKCSQNQYYQYSDEYKISKVLISTGLSPVPVLVISINWSVLTVNQSSSSCPINILSYVGKQIL